MTLTDCDFGGSTVAESNKIEIVDTDKLNGAASIFSEGSLTNILVILSITASVVSISLSIVLYKRKAAPVAVNDAAKTEDEDADEE